MRVSMLRIGSVIGDLTVTGLKRHGAWSLITLSDGSTFDLHKGASLDRDLRSSVASGSVGAASKVRASDPAWRGENRGKRGERFIARNSTWDRATREVTPR